MAESKPEPKDAQKESRPEQKAAGSEAKPETREQRADARLEAWQAEQDGQRKELLMLSEISIWIDTYDDIFSSFDPRPYQHRALSVDFLDESRRAIREKSDKQLTLRLLAPTAIRNGQMETTIRKRLKEHFTAHAQQKQAEQRAISRRGIWYCIIGSLILIAATIIAWYGVDSIYKEFLVILLDPAGWFTFWNGLDLLFFKPKDLVQEADFYRRMSEAEIRFESY